jgi:hypothetical protein
MESLMAAIITKDTRLHNAKQFIEGVSESANTIIYMFLGRPTSWDNESAPDTPLDTYRSQIDIWDNMEALKRVNASDVAHVVPRNTWIAGNVYFQYNDGVSASTLFDSNFVVVNSEYNVYKCLSNGGGNITINEPTGTGATANNLVFNTGIGEDGYVWKYMTTISVSDWAKFGTASFIPVRNNATATLNSANARGIYAYDIALANIGSALYADGTHSVVIVGDGSGAEANIVVSSGNIANVIVKSYGSDYTVATIANNLGSANVFPIVAPPDGHGYDAIDELGGVYTMVNVRFEQTDTLVPVTGFKFRQVGLIKDPFLFGTTTVPATGNALLKAYGNITISGSITNGGALVSGATLTGQTSGANASVVSYSGTGTVFNFIQARNSSPNVLANYTDFQIGESVSVGASTIGTIAALGNATVHPRSGEVIYVDNRNVITRASDQEEDIYVVLEF